MTITRNLGGWFEYALMASRRVYIYRFNAFFSIVLTGVTIYLLTVVWRSAYAGRTEVGGIAIGQMLTYLTIANLQVRFLTPDVDEEIRDRITQGQIAFDLNRPSSYPGMLMAGAAGKMAGMLPMLVVGLPVAFIAGELRPPESVAAGFAYAASLLLAWVIAVELNLAIGLISFWTLELTGFQMIYRLVGNFATGALIPLWFMPDLVRYVIQALPFQAMAYLPVSIYIGEPATGHIVTALLVQLTWVGLMVLIIRWIWQRAFAHTVIQGG
jgi:ABC-2 type transport system permease protein